MDSNNDETEIVCPYCDEEFIARIGFDENQKIECPECHNIIELDMDAGNIENDIHGNFGCGGHCSRCGRCGHE